MLKIDSALVKRLKNLPLDEDFISLDSLRGEFSHKLNSRKEKFLDSKEFEQILCWKLDTQAHRSKQLRLVNVDGLVIPITKAYFNLKSENFEYETEVKIKLLTSLKGVGTPLASAVMAITEPQKYCIVDSVLWEFIFNEEKSSFTTNDYLKFHKVIIELSEKLDRDVQKTEFTLWKLSMTSK
jgi:hypothetical protein